MTKPVETVVEAEATVVEAIRDAALVSTEIKKLATKLGKVGEKAGESEAEVDTLNEKMLKMMQGEIAQTGKENIAILAKEQQKFMKKGEKVREAAVEDAKTLRDTFAELGQMVEALIAPYQSKFVDDSEPNIDEDVDGDEGSEEA